MNQVSDFKYFLEWMPDHPFWSIFLLIMLSVTITQAAYGLGSKKGDDSE